MCMLLNRLLLSIILAYFIPCISHAQYSWDNNYVHYSFYYNGYWGEWKYDTGTRIQGNYDGFVIYRYIDRHPSEYFFKFSIYNYGEPSKKEIKNHYKNKTWWEFDGVIEYYVCDLYPTMSDFVKVKQRFLEDWDVNGTEYEKKLSAMKASKMLKGQSFTPIGFKKVSKRATIKIAPYKKVPRVYNIYTDDCGIALDLRGLHFVEK